MGADYRKQHQSILGSVSVNSIVANVTRYTNPNGSINFAGEAQARMRIPYTCTIRNLYTRSSIAPGAGETFTYTIMVNGIASALTCQIAGAVLLEANDLVNVVAIALGDEISLRVVTSLNAAVGYHTLSLEVDR